jgi:site-specific DNA-methyltransferase (adenine-specific)
MKQIPDKSVDLIICDLPYGCLMRGGNGAYDRGKDSTVGKERGIDWDIKIDLEPFWKEIRRIRSSDHSPTIHFCTTKFGYELMQSNPDEFRYDLVWDKQRGVSPLHVNKRPMRSHEMIYVFSKAGAFYERKDINDGNKRCVLSVIQQNGIHKKGNHPTEKPCDLYKWLIERYCPPGGTVLDPTFGSGNSVFTAFAMGRSAIGIEKDEAFFKKAVERLNALP